MTVAIYVFAFSAAGVFYLLFGYPILLALWPTRRTVKCHPSNNLRTVTVILPVKNGERWIQQKLESIFDLDYPAEMMQIIVISDHSTDGTEEIVQRYADRVLLLQSPGTGKASAITHGLKYATGEILFMTDVRQPIESNALRMLVACFDDPEVGVASGELIIRKSDLFTEENVGLYWKYEKWIRKRHSAIDSVMGASGAIYTMRRSLARPLPAGTLLDDVQLPLGAFFDGYRVVFVENAHAFDAPTALKQEFHRKVRTLAGVYQIVGAYPQLLGPNNRMWIHFLSHKLGRLLLPFLLASTFLSSFFLPSPWNLWAVLSQVAFYLLAFIDPFVPPSPVKKLSSLVRTFVVLMWATACAITILFRPSETLWKTSR